MNNNQIVMRLAEGSSIVNIARIAYEESDPAAEAESGEEASESAEGQTVSEGKEHENA